MPKVPKMTRYKEGQRFTMWQAVSAQLGFRPGPWCIPEAGDIDPKAVYTVMRLRIDSQRITKASTRANVRCMASLEALADITRAVKDDVELPPIIVDDTGIIDGFHRYNVYKGEGYTHVWAFVKTKNKPRGE